MEAATTASNDLPGVFEFSSLTLETRYGHVPFNAAPVTLTLGGNALQTAAGGATLYHPDGGAAAVTNRIELVGDLELAGHGHGHLLLSRLSGNGRLVVNRPGHGHVVLGQHDGGGDVHLLNGQLAVNGPSALGSGTLRVLGGTVRANSFASPDGIVVPNPVVASTDLVFTGNNSLVFAGPISGSGGFIHRPNASITARMRATNTYGGATLVALPTAGNFSGTLRIDGAGSALNSPLFQVARFGTLALDNRLANVPDRISDDATVNLDSRAIFSLQSDPSGQTQERVGTLRVSGSPFVNVNSEQPTATSTSGTLRIGSFLPSPASMTLMRGIGLGSATPGTPGSDNVLLDNVTTAELVGGGGPAGSTTIGILTHVVSHHRGSGTTWFGAGNALATYDPVRGVRPLDPASEYAASLPIGATTQQNVRLLTLESGVDAPTTVNALVLDRASSSNFGRVAGSGTLKVASGVIIAAGGGGSSAPTSSLRNRIDVDTLDFGTSMARIFAPERLTITSRITGSGGLSKTGGFELYLANSSNSYTGTVTIGGGTLRVNEPEAIGGSGAIVLDGGTLQIDTSSTLSRDLFCTQAIGFVSVPTSVDVVLGGNLAGDAFEKTGPGSLRIPATSANTLSGRMAVSGGSLILESAPGLPSATIAVRAGGTLVSDVNPVVVPQTVLLDAGGEPRVIETRSPLRLTGRLGDTGAIGNALTLTKTGGSTLDLDGDADFDGPLLVQEGTVRVNGLLRQVNTSAVGLRVSGNAALGGSGIIERDVLLEPGAIVSPGQSAGVLTVLGNLTTLGSLRFDWEIGDRLVVDGTFLLPPDGMTIRLDNLDGQPFGGTYVLVDAVSIAGGPGSFSLDYTLAPQWASLGLTVQVTATQVQLVPEPTALLGSSVAAIALLARRRRCR